MAEGSPSESMDDLLQQLTKVVKEMSTRYPGRQTPALGAAMPAQQNRSTREAGRQTPALGGAAMPAQQNGNTARQTPAVSVPAQHIASSKGSGWQVPAVSDHSVPTQVLKDLSNRKTSQQASAIPAVATPAQQHGGKASRQTSVPVQQGRPVWSSCGRRDVLQNDHTQERGDLHTQRSRPKPVKRKALQESHTKSSDSYHERVPAE